MSAGTPAGLVPVLVLVLAAAGCGSSSAGANPGSGCEPLPNLTADSSTSAPASDARAVLSGNCALGGCHASAPGAGGLVLDVRSPSWADALVGVASEENPSMNLVTAGDPGDSWLVHKVYGAVCGYSCDPSLGCGGQMPFGGSLGETQRATLVAWIEAGALRD